MNTLNIIKGRVDGAKRVIIYGPEGIGKSTLASKFPAPLFLDTEDGSGELDVDRVPCLDWRAIESAVRNFPAGYKTCVIDTADWAERALTEHFLKTKGLKSIEDVSFGKGFTQVAELWARFLADLDGLIARGINVVLVAHSKVTKVSPPDQTDGYDRYELKLSKPSVGPTKEWAQMVLFGNFKLNLVEGTDGRIKAQGGKERVMYATHSAAWDAKNRFNLPDEVPMEFESIAHIFTNAPTEVAPVQAAPVAQPETQAQPDRQPGAITPEQLQKLETYRKNSVGKPIIDAALNDAVAVDLAELSEPQAAALIARVQAAMNGDAPKSAGAVHVSAAIAGWLDKYALQIEEYFIRIGWLKAGQKWRDLPKEQQLKIGARADSLAKNAGIPSPTTKAA